MIVLTVGAAPINQRPSTGFPVVAATAALGVCRAAQALRTSAHKLETASPASRRTSSR